jgi:hypothetical protein
MVQSGRWVVFIMGVAKTKLFKEPFRDTVLGVMAGKKPIHIEGIESVSNDGISRLPGVPTAPSMRTNVKPDLK